MAVTKILARHYRVDTGINYVLNGDKTEDKLLTAFQYCGPKNAYSVMMQTKKDAANEGGVQCYHIIQSYKPGELSPELALSIARQFTAEHLAGYEAVIGVHVDKKHIHAHIMFNSVNRETGKKYHSNAKSYYEQIRGITDRLCAEHGLSVIMTGRNSHAISYYEWLREKRGLPTYRSMLEADLHRAIDDANDYGHFLTVMEHMGYEVKHGSRLSFRLRGQEHWFVPGRKNALFTEDGIRQAIQGNLEAIEAGLRPMFTQRRTYTPYKKHPKYTGFLALYRHYLYLLGKIQKQEYPPRMTAHMKTEVMKFDKYKAQFKFLMDHNISTERQMQEYEESADAKIAALTKQRTILNVKKKKRKQLYDALADAEALCPVAELYAEGMTGIETEFARYMDAVKTLDECGIPKETLSEEKAQVYGEIAEINKEIRKLKNDLNVIKEIREVTPSMEKDIHHTENIKTKEVTRDDRSK
jgi:hypothetical protein